MIKIALIGTSCSGKTTTAYNVVGRLRKDGYHAEGCLSSDRNYTFPQSKLDFMHEAQSYVIMQQAFLELKMAVRDDVDICISDRSTIDFFAYYEYCINDKYSPYYIAMKELAFNWLNTYDIVFYLSPLPWVNDGKRPNDEFRLGVDSTLKLILDLNNFRNVIKIENNINSEEFIYNYVKKIC